MSVVEYGRLLSRFWPLILIGLIVGIAGATVLTVVQRPTYQSEAKVLVAVGGASNVTDLNQGGTYAQQVAKSYADIATTSSVLTPVITSLRLDESFDDLVRHVSVTSVPDTVVLEIDARDHSRQRAADIANAVARQLSRVVGDLGLDTDKSDAQVKITQVDTARPATTPISPNVPLYLVAGAALGIFLAVAIALLRDKTDDRLRSLDEAAKRSGLSLLGAVVEDPKASKSPLASMEDAASARAEAYRALRTNLQYVDLSSAPVQVIMVTSSLPSEGKSVTTANLAVAMAAVGRRVIVVDCDLRRPMLATYFGTEQSVGLTDVLVGRTQLVDATQRLGLDASLSVLPSGPTPPNPAELLQSDAMHELIGSLRSHYDIVLLDTPPVLSVADAAGLVRMADGALLVVAIGVLGKNELTASLAALDTVHARVLGLVGNRLQPRGNVAYSRYGAERGGPAAQPPVRPSQAAVLTKRATQEPTKPPPRSAQRGSLLRPKTASGASPADEAPPAVAAPKVGKAPRKAPIRRRGVRTPRKK